MMLRTRAFASIGAVLVLLALGLGLVADPLVRDTLREQHELSLRLDEIRRDALASDRSGGAPSAAAAPAPPTRADSGSGALVALWLGIALAAVAAPWICGVALRSLFRPIDALRRACAHLHDEGPAPPLDDGRRDELGVLCAAFDRLRERVRQSRRRRQRHHEQLETLVGEKTRQLAATIERLRSLDQMKDAFLACSSHELRAPVRSIVAASTALQRPLRRELRADLLKCVLAEGRRLRRMTDDVLDLVSASAAGFDCRPGTTTVQAVIRRALAAARERAERGDVEIQLVHLGDCTVVWDEEWISRLLASIVARALASAPEGGRIVVENRLQGPDVRLEVRFPVAPARTEPGTRDPSRGRDRALWAPVVERHLGEWSEEESEEHESVVLVLPRLSEHLEWQKAVDSEPAAVTS